ncbi:hypothetical protein P7C70_g5728, partial [Phenoliferia sp. Uapishka_3]
MGRSAKMMKRPTKAEKVARTINAPPRPRQRSISPEIESAKSAIPLFNTSAKRGDHSKLSAKAAPAPDKFRFPDVTGPTVAMELEAEDGMNEDEDEDETAEPSEGGNLIKKKSNFKDKVKIARAAVEEAEIKGREKLSGKTSGGKPGGKKGHVLGGTDYLKQFESRPGGFKKKMR